MTEYTHDGEPIRSARPRHWYAVGYAYMRAISDIDILARFNSKQDRDAYCEARNANGYEGEWEPVTLASIRHRFDIRQFESDYQELYRQDGASVKYIYQRAGYQL